MHGHGRGRRNGSCFGCRDREDAAPAFYSPASREVTRRGSHPGEISRGRKKALNFLRAVLGDIPAGDAGVTYAHEHIIIDPGFATFTNPDFLLDSVSKACLDVEEWKAAGGRTIIDSMPCGA